MSLSIGNAPSAFSLPDPAGPTGPTAPTGPTDPGDPFPPSTGPYNPIDTVDAPSSGDLLFGDNSTADVKTTVDCPGGATVVVDGNTVTITCTPPKEPKGPSPAPILD
jgi:hypothetical protein